MVAKAGGYYRAALKGARDVTQGDPLPPTIFNVVVDAVLQNWVTVMTESAEERGGRGQEGRHQNLLFYVDDGMVALSDLRWFQGDFSTLVGLFGKVGLNNNVGKIVGMVCRPCQVVETQLEAAYGRRMTGVGNSYRERQQGQIQCKECGEEMVLGSLAGHIHTQHVREMESRRRWEYTTPVEEPRTYRMAFPTSRGPCNCPVEGCPGRASTRIEMQVHFSTGMSGIPLSFWRRETYLTHSAPDET